VNNIDVVARPLWRVLSLAKAIIRVMDTAGNPVVGVTVTTHWSGITSDSDGRVTDDNGQAVIWSNLNWLDTGEFRIHVDNITGGDFNYDPSLNSETTDAASWGRSRNEPTLLEG
jgi:hypothetical protein